MGDILWKNKNNQWEYNLEELILYIEKLSKECAGKYELCKKLGVYRDFLDLLCKKENIKLNYKFIINKNNSNFTAIYQNYKWCYQKYIVEGLSHEEMAKEAGCSKRVIEKWCCEKHRLTQKYRQKNKTLNKKQHDLLIGSMLGDGHIDRRKTQPMFIVSHAKNQKDYLYFKYEIIKNLCNIPPVYIKAKYSKFSTDKEYLCQPQYRLCTRIYDCFKYYRNKSYTELLKELNEFSLSIWALDDGHRANFWGLCVAEYTKEDIEYAIYKLKKDFNLIANSSKSDNRYLNFNADSSRRLDDIILNNIPNEFDVIQYKIINNDNIKSKQHRIIYKDMYLIDYCRQNDLDYKSVTGRVYRGATIEEAVNVERNMVV